MWSERYGDYYDEIKQKRNCTFWYILLKPIEQIILNKLNSFYSKW